MPKADAFKAIADLPEKRREQLDDLLTKGLAASQVAQIVQTEWKIWVKQNPATVKKRLERYRAGPLKAKLVDQISGATKGMTIAGLAKRVSALDELTELVMAQKGRYLKALQIEAKAGGVLLTKQATDEGRLLKEMLVELGRLQLETPQPTAQAA